MIILNAYRIPSGSHKTFRDTIKEGIESIQKWDRYEFYLLGDLNTDQFKPDQPNARALKNIVEQHGLTLPPLHYHRYKIWLS